ncbi:DUF7343 domain-containing protein [Methanosarcina sp. T3]|uniref:helix-turn-helix transcriptional regulator n=1 Tax=Methanosarcina sp. T3 TaxID=3439062 RepID=UPI003F8442B7
MNLKVYIICVAAAVLFAVPVLADGTATIHGEVYSWDTFEPLENAVVEVNSTPAQSMVAKYGVYYFELDPGDYLIKASYYENSTLIYSAEEVVTIKGEGSYVRDLLLLPVYSTILMEGENNSSTSIPVNNNSDSDIGSNDENSSDINVSVPESNGINGSTFSTYYLLAALVLSLLLAGGYSFQKHRNVEKKKPENEKSEKNQLEANKLEKNRLQEGKAVHETAVYEAEKLSAPVNIPNLSAELPDERVAPTIEKEIQAKPAETLLSEESDYELRNKEIEAGRKAEQTMPEMEPAGLELEAEEYREKAPEGPSPEGSVQVPEPTKLPEPEAPAVKKNLPLPADLQEIMDIIRGQGGRITQKDLRSKLRYSEGKVSLMLADLERRELIEKFKRGRGNVVIIRDEER